MKLDKFINHIREIRPDPEYTRRSRLVFAASHVSAPQHIGRNFIKQVFRAGSTAFATALLIIFLVVGGVIIGNLFGSSKLADLDLNTIRAEADAIDIQIELNKLYYEDTALPAKRPVQADATAPRTPEEEIPANETVSIDEILEKLSEE